MPRSPGSWRSTPTGLTIQRSSSEALRLSEGLSDPASLASCLEHAAILQNRVGEFAMAERLYERLDALGPASVPADRRLEFRAILALNTGRLA